LKEVGIWLKDYFVVKGLNLIGGVPEKILETC
jgi:hypothetical protein